MPIFVESSFGCANSIIDQVNVNYLPVSNFTSDSVCFGDVTNFNSGLCVKTSVPKPILVGKKGNL